MTEKIEKLLVRKAQIDRRISIEKTAIKASERSRTTRKKILAGACVLKIAEGDEKFRAWLNSKLAKYLTASYDRQLFSLQISSALGDCSDE